MLWDADWKQAVSVQVPLLGIFSTDTKACLKNPVLALKWQRQFLFLPFWHCLAAGSGGHMLEVREDTQCCAHVFAYCPLHFLPTSEDENHETKTIECIVSQSDSVNQCIGLFLLCVHVKECLCVHL